MEVGGFAAHEADDLLITLRYRASRWEGIYLPEILALGMTPVDWDGYLRQQIRWVRSVIDIKLHVDNQSTYYKDHWLSGTMSLVDYGHRGVPNVVLAATLTKGGAWNAAHFDNPEYDGLVAQYVAALDLDTQRQIAGQIETLLLDETPYIVAYYFDSISVSKKSIGGVVTTGMGQIYLSAAGPITA